MDEGELLIIPNWEGLDDAGRDRLNALSTMLTDQHIPHFFATSLDMLGVLLTRKADRERVFLVVEPRSEDAQGKLLERLGEFSLSETARHLLSELVESKPEDLPALLERWRSVVPPEEPPMDHPHRPARMEGEP